jgi:hypothetical protein
MSKRGTHEGETRPDSGYRYRLSVSAHRPGETTANPRWELMPGLSIKNFFSYTHAQANGPGALPVLTMSCLRA